MSQHWLFQINDGKNFYKTVRWNAWSLYSATTCDKNFMAMAKEGDIIWFVLGKSNKLIVATAIYQRMEKRILGPILAMTITNEEMGVGPDFNPDYLLFFTNYIDLTLLKNPIVADRTFRQGKIQFDASKGTNLLTEWSYISRCVSDGILSYSVPLPPSAELIRIALSKNSESDSESDSESQDEYSADVENLAAVEFTRVEGLRLVTGYAVKQMFNSDDKAIAYAKENNYNCITKSGPDGKNVYYYFGNKNSKKLLKSLNRARKTYDRNRSSFYAQSC